MQASPESFFSVPKTYPELQARYGGVIKKLLVQANRFAGNFDDLHSYVWMKLLEAQLLDRFQEHMDRQLPKTLTAIQVCDLLGVGWQEWVDALVASHTGARPAWMPTPVNVEEFNIQGIPWYNAPTALFSFGDILCLAQGVRIHGVVYWAFERWGRDVRGGRVMGESRPEGHLNIPVIRPTANQFKNYLTMAVLNHYANFCRTLKRRHKERPQSLHGDDGHATSWEDTLVEQKQPSIEVKLQLSEARRMMKNAVYTCLQDLGISSGGDEESKIFAQLEQGASLIQALKHCGFPTRVRKSVIKSIRARPEGGAIASEES